jgi:hypothetical protein
VILLCAERLKWYHHGSPVSRFGFGYEHGSRAVFLENPLYVGGHR